MRVNAKGEIALAYFQPIPKVVKGVKGEYAFVVRHGVSLSWVNPEDVDKIFEIRNSCRSCGTSAPAFRYATDLQVKVWETGHY